MRKRQLLPLGTILMTLVLNGCITLNETSFVQPEAIKLSEVLNVRVEGFGFLGLQEVSGYIGHAGYTHNYDSDTRNALITSSSYPYRGFRNYIYAPDRGFSDAVLDSFEQLGYNVQSQEPLLLIKGRVNKGIYDVSHLGWDVPVNILGVITLFSVWSSTYINDASLIVYDLKGNRLASYRAGHSCNVAVLSLPFGTLFDRRINDDSYIRQKAGFAAVMDCIYSFQQDMQNGKFNQVITETRKTIPRKRNPRFKNNKEIKE